MADKSERVAVAVTALPDEKTNAGAMARLFIVEAISPGMPRYKAEENLTAMRLMRQVIANRLKEPALYSARGARSEIDIIKAGNQYAGFGSYPALYGRLSINLKTILQYASDPNWPTQAKYARFVNDAIQAATESISPPLAASAVVTAWRTEGSSSPGSNFVKVGTFSGNTFYSTQMPAPRRGRR